jgi:hypothetical protein
MQFNITGYIAFFKKYVRYVWIRAIYGKSFKTVLTNFKRPDKNEGVKLSTKK